MASLMRYGDAWDAPRYDSECSYVWEEAAALLEWLKAQPGEKILDLGSGTGHLAGRIAASGAAVTGLDSSPMMIGQAMWNFPKIPFVLGDARDFHFPDPFQAVISNAVLHWIENLDAVFGKVHAALVPGGRFIGELGTTGNIAQVTEAFFAEMTPFGVSPTEAPWHFHSPEAVTTALQNAGFTVEQQAVIDRPTPLSSGAKGLRRWYEIYVPALLDRLPAGQRDAFYEAVEARLKDKLFREGVWSADYRRFRFFARRA